MDKAMEEGNISIEGLSKAAVLAALYNNAAPKGLGYFQRVEGDMTEAEAQEILDTGQTYFDYLMGRVVKVDLSGADFWPGTYDRDNGTGAANKAIESLRNRLVK